MDRISNRIGRMLARYLDKPATGYEPFTPSNPVLLARALEPGDVLLVEGNTHIAGVIKYLTQSTWSHAALYVGPVASQGGETKTEAKTADGEPHELIEANIGEGVVSAPLSKYFKFHTRVCRPVGLTADDLDKVCRYAIDRIGLDYDLKNIIDLLRYLMPLPVPQRWRRHMIALGSGDPTRIICSALIAQAFEIRALSDPAARHHDDEPHGAARNSGNPPFLALCAARLRHLALFRSGEADHRVRLRLQGDALGRPAAAARRRRAGAGALARRRQDRQDRTTKTRTAKRPVKQSPSGSPSQRMARRPAWPRAAAPRSLPNRRPRTRAPARSNRRLKGLRLKRPRSADAILDTPPPAPVNGAHSTARHISAGRQGP